MCIYSTVRMTRAGGRFYKRMVFCRERLHLFIILAFCSPLLVPPGSSCRKCGEKSNAADQTGFLGNKTAGHKSRKGRRARRFRVFPRTSEIQARRRGKRGNLHHICPVKTGGSRYGCHPFVLYPARSRPTTSQCRVPGARRPTPRRSRRPSRSSRSHRGHASGR